MIDRERLGEGCLGFRRVVRAGAGRPRAAAPARRLAAARARRPRFAGAREVGGAGVDEGQVVGPAELAWLERSRLPQARLGGVEQLVAEIEQAEGVAECRRRPPRPAATKRSTVTRFLELPRHRRLENTEHGRRDRGKVGKGRAGLGPRIDRRGLTRRLGGQRPAQEIRTAMTAQ